MTRHFYRLFTNDPSRSLCGKNDGLVRMTDTNVDCPDCLSILDSLRGKPEMYCHDCGNAYGDRHSASCSFRVLGYFDTVRVSDCACPSCGSPDIRNLICHDCGYEMGEDE